MDLLVTTDWLAAELGGKDIRLLDASYHPLDPGRDAVAEFAGGHIPGAAFLDLAGLGPATGEVLARRLGEAGVGRDSRIILYDATEHRTAARAWWLLAYFGFPHVAILDGGLDRWRAEGRTLERGAAPPLNGAVPALRLDPALARDMAQMKALVAVGGAQIVDARSAARFIGAEPDPRPGIAPGHIPGSLNLPYGRMVESDGRWKRGDALRAAFGGAGVDPDRPFVATCGSGVTAAVLLFGARLLGQTDGALYDGSWREWGGDPTTPKATGA